MLPPRECVGALLAQYRRRALLPAAAAADGLGVAPSTLYRIERGRSLPNLQLFAALCQRYAMSDGEAIEIIRLFARHP